jgi:hypothetical protein
MDALNQALALLADKNLVWSADFEKIRVYLGGLILDEVRMDAPNPHIVYLCLALIADA